MPEITSIQMYANATGDAAASIDVPQDGQLVAVVGLIVADAMNANGERVESEISFNSTNQRTTNDARAGIAHMGLGVSTGTTEMIPTHTSIYIDLKDGITVNAGERIYQHNEITTGVGARVRWMLYFRLRSTRRAATRRR